MVYILLWLVLKCISYILLWSFFWPYVDREHNGNFHILFKLSSLLNQLYYTGILMSYFWETDSRTCVIGLNDFWQFPCDWIFVIFSKKTQHIHQKCLAKDTAKQSSCCSAFHCFSCCQVISFAVLHFCLGFGVFLPLSDLMAFMRLSLNWTRHS